VSAHTPGPWSLSGVMALDTPMWIVSVPGEQARIEISDYSQESEANARLIAAAPDLLAALEGLVEVAKAALEEVNRDGAEWHVAAELAEARAAIAKARGQ
jgi:hypothetical protein